MVPRNNSCMGVFSFNPIPPVVTGVNNYRRIVGTEVGGRVMSLKGG